jgi:LuxR family transcriptional regulator, positive regulator of biofilm formation
MIQDHLLYLVAQPDSEVGRFVEELCALLDYSVCRIEHWDENKSQKERRSIVLWAFDSFPEPSLDIVQSKQAQHIACGTPINFVAENQFLSGGYSGIISCKNMASTFVKAIEAILNGELWYSRKALCHFAATALDDKTSYQIGVCRQTAEKFECLTPKERCIAKSLFLGLSNKEIAHIAHISLHTAKAHIYNIYRKLDVSSRAEAMNLAQKIQPLLQQQRAVRQALRA